MFSVPDWRKTSKTNFWGREKNERRKVMAGILVGFIISVLGSYAWWLLLVAFFLSSTVLRLYKVRVKAVFKKKFESSFTGKQCGL